MLNEEQDIIQEFSIREENKNFFNYMKDLNLDKESSTMLILPSNHFFFYMLTEVSHIRTIVFLKQLNYIKDILETLHSFYQMTDKGAVFCGCFLNNKKINIIPTKEHRYSKFFRGLVSIIDLQMYHLLSEKSVHDFFISHNFEIKNMKEIDGVTYFYAIRI
jgi:hypothetical protein